MSEAKLEILLQETGDGIANMFEQLERGDWVDCVEHDVRLNQQRLNLQKVLANITKYRSEYLGYTEMEDA